MLMNMNKTISCIRDGRAVLGIELGSTRIKAVLIDDQFVPVASGSCTWENRLENGIWTYRLEDMWTALQSAYADLKRDVQCRYGVVLTAIQSFGISAMMHGYLPFDAEGRQLVEFRTWRNTMTAQAAEALTARLKFNIPQRWSIAHLYQAVLNGEEHVGRIARLTTLAGYVHWKLTGEYVLGVNDASGMFPVNPESCDYDTDMLALAEKALEEEHCQLKLRDILPPVRSAGENAGCLTIEGAGLLDPSGDLTPGAPAAPPEGDAGTGMVATNSIAPRKGNVSAGTSVFSMVVLEKQPTAVHEEIDIVTTPTGSPVAMVHCNNCTSDINAWAGMLKEFAEATGNEVR